MEKQTKFHTRNFPGRWWIFIGLVMTVVFSAAASAAGQPAQAKAYAQIPTGSVPTVTSTASGPIVTVRLDIDQPQINVRAGPGTTYDKVGVLLLGPLPPTKITGQQDAIGLVADTDCR